MDLSNCCLANKTAIAFAEFLLKNNFMQQCFLLNNNISKNGAVKLAEALKTNKCLNILNLDFNEIGDEGAKALLKVFDQNENIEIIEICNNNVSKDIVYKFEKKMSSMQQEQTDISFMSPR